jgi:hypothetical protein
VNEVPHLAAACALPCFLHWLETGRRDASNGTPCACHQPCGDLRDRLPGCKVQCFGMGPAVVAGQDLSEVTGPVCDGTVTDLATGDRKLSNGHREATGR